jgi:dienelactone hydrolase
MKTFFLATFLLAAAMTADAQDLKPVSYADGTQQLSGLMTPQNGKNRPGVLILPAWKGIDEEAREAARMLAKEGYTAFIADIYGVGKAPKNDEEAKMMSGMFKADYALYQKRISLALEQFKKASGTDRVAVIGYCFGGTGALEAARGQLPVLGVVSIHGGLAKAENRPNGPMGVKVLVENPDQDASVTPEQLQQLRTELNEGKADWQLITYAYSKHTFTDPKSPDYNPTMAKRAWQHTLLFLKEVLR